MITQIIADDKAERAVLETFAKNNGVFALELGMTLGDAAQRAIFDKMLEAELIRLMDLRPVPDPRAGQPGHMMRFFRMTKEGEARLTELRSKAVIDLKVKS